MAKLKAIKEFTGKDGNSYIRLSFEPAVDKAAKKIVQPKDLLLSSEQGAVYKDCIGYEVTTSEA